MSRWCDSGAVTLRAASFVSELGLVAAGSGIGGLVRAGC